MLNSDVLSVTVSYMVQMFVPPQADQQTMPSFTSDSCILDNDAPREMSQVVRVSQVLVYYLLAGPGICMSRSLVSYIET